MTKQIILLCFVALSFGCVDGQQSSDIFQHGVASGDPLADKVIIWTRVSVDNPIQGVEWEMALDQNFDEIIQKGAAVGGPFNDFTVKVDVDGLQPHTSYFYRFNTDGFFSPVGRTKTLPVGEVEQISLAIVSNANWRQGYFNVYNAVSNLVDVDFVLITGDYIMSYSADEMPDDYETSAREGLLPEDQPESVEDFRQRYGVYRSDEDLQKMHQNFAVIPMWDDQEFQEGAFSYNVDDSTWEQKKQNGLQAYFEWMPVRMSNESVYYRSYTFGNLAVLNIPETRISERSTPIDGRDFLEDINAVLPLDSSLWSLELYQTATAQFYQSMASTKNQILGQQQLQWLQQQIKDAEQTGVAWNLIMMGSPLGSSHFPDLINSLDSIESESDRMLLNTFVQLLSSDNETSFFMASGYFGLPADPESWDGYSYERHQLYNMMSSGDIASIVFSGDAYGRAGELVQDSGKIVGVEFTTPGVSEKSFYSSFGDAIGNNLNIDWVSWFNNGLKLSNPGLKFADVQDSGFIVASIGQSSIESTFYSVSSIMEKDFGVFCRASFSVSRDDPTLLLPLNCTAKTGNEFIPNTIQFFTLQQMEAAKSAGSELSVEGMITQAVLPFVLNATASGEEVDMDALLQTPEVYSLMTTLLMDQFSDLTNLTLNTENDENMAASIVQMALQSVLNTTTSDSLYDFNYQPMVNTSLMEADDVSQYSQYANYTAQNDDSVAAGISQSNTTSKANISDIILPFVLQAATSGEDLDVDALLQTPAVQSYIFDQVMDNFTDLTNLPINSEENEDAAAWLVQMSMQTVLNQTSHNSSTLEYDSQSGVSVEQTSPSPMDIAQSVNQKAPLDITGKWTSILINQSLLYTSQNGTGLMFNTVSRQLFLKDDATYTAQYDTFWSNLIGSGGSSESKEGFWSVDEMAGMLYLQVTFCDQDANIVGNNLSTTPSVLRTSTCATDDEQYQLSQAKQIDQIFLGDDKYFISDIDG